MASLPHLAAIIGRLHPNARIGPLGNNTISQHRFDPFYGRRVTGDLADAGLAEVGCEGRTSMWRGGEAGGRIWRLTLGWRPGADGQSPCAAGQ